VPPINEDATIAGPAVAGGRDTDAECRAAVSTPAKAAKQSRTVYAR